MRDRRAFLAATTSGGVFGAVTLAAQPQAPSTDAIPRNPDYLSILRFIPGSLHAPILTGTNTTPLDPYFDAAVAAANQTFGWPRAIFLPAGKYKVTRPIVCPNVSLVGDGRRATVLDGSSLVPGQAVILQEGGSGYLDGARIQCLSVVGSGQSLGLEISGLCGVTIRDCRFAAHNAAIKFHNRVPGSFTECCVAENCEFDISCDRVLRYTVTGGNDSFHGSGLRHCFINTRGLPVEIGAGSTVYNAPMYATIWLHDFANPIFWNEGNPASFYGHLAVEVFAPSVVGALLNRVVFLGSLLIKGQPSQWSRGTLDQCMMAIGESCA